MYKRRKGENVCVWEREVKGGYKEGIFSSHLKPIYDTMYDARITQGVQQNGWNIVFMEDIFDR